MRRLLPLLTALGLLACPALARAAVQEFPLPATGAHPLGIAQAPDGSLSFLENGTGRIDRITADGAITRSAPQLGYADLTHAIFDAAGRLWVSGGSSDRIGRAAAGDPLGALGTWYFTPGCVPTGLAAGPDGNLWFTKLGCSIIGRIASSSSPNSRHFDVGLPSGTGPRRIATGPDGALWFTAWGSGRIGRLTTAGTVTWPVAGGLDRPWDITPGPDGNLWATENGGTGAILRITPAGELTRFAAGLQAGAAPQEIVAGADGNLWFTEYGADAIGRITPDGTITEFPLTAGAGPRGIAAASDGSIWFTEYDGDRVGRWTPDPVVAPPAPAPVAAASPAAPEPELGRTVVAGPTQGTVLIRTPGSDTPTVLDSADGIPVGSVIDTRRGHVAITTALPGNRKQLGTFWGGIFQVRQSRAHSARGRTDLLLRRSALSCPRVRASAAAKHKARHGRARSNGLWGSDRNGRFRTHGRNATATVRGTLWRTTDTCTGTRVTVRSGAVVVRDKLRHRNHTVRAGHTLLVRNARRR